MLHSSDRKKEKPSGAQHKWSVSQKKSVICDKVVHKHETVQAVLQNQSYNSTTFILTNVSKFLEIGPVLLRGELKNSIRPDIC